MIEYFILADLMATNNTFYNQTRQDGRFKCFFFNNENNSSSEYRKRQALDENVLKNHRENNHRLSLMKMAQATRTFWSQTEALDFIADRQKMNNSDEILYLFSFESQPEGKRRYQVADIDVFIQEY
jgi:hypothetical protein